MVLISPAFAHELHRPRPSPISALAGARAAGSASHMHKLPRSVQDRYCIMVAWHRFGLVADYSRYTSSRAFTVSIHFEVYYSHTDITTHTVHNITEIWEGYEGKESEG